ncbi:MAG: fumarate reductase/succinate dehydrogenase flavoprotein subunit [Bacteroidota bacterium]
MKLDPRIPEGPLTVKWSKFRSQCKVINPTVRRKHKVIVVGTGLAGSAVSASLAELGFQVEVFTYHDSPRRAHSVAAQGGVNAAKNYKNDSDTVWRMFYDTIKGGDFRAREANVYRLAECSAALIDHAVAQGVPFAREYGGYLGNRSFGGVQVSRTFYARGETGHQLMQGAYQQLMRQVSLGNIELHTRHEMLDLVVADGQARGVICRNLDTGEITSHAAHAVVLATGGYGKIYYYSTLAMQCNATAIWRAHKCGAGFAAPSWTQFHPTSLPLLGDFQSKMTLMSESLRNDGRIWVPIQAGDDRPADQIPEAERDYYLERQYPSFGNLAPRDLSSRAAKRQVDQGKGVGPMKNAVYLDFKDAITRFGKDEIKKRYGNLFSMYEKITGRNAYEEPMMIAPSAHFSMGGLWVDYQLMTTVPGLFALGEANFSDHGANRLGANSLLQACVDGYFIGPTTIMDYLAGAKVEEIDAEHELFSSSKKHIEAHINKLINIKGTTSPNTFHKEIGKLLYNQCGLSRNKKDLEDALEQLKSLEKRFYEDLLLPADHHNLNSELEKAGRVSDYLELAQLIVMDALTRHESCGAHFREEYQTDEGEAKRDDENFCFISVWEHQSSGQPELHKEHLSFEEVQLTQRSYK